MYQMDPEVKQLWILGLLSNRYLQGRGAMRRKNTLGDQYCALGVLCQLHAEETNTPWEYINKKYSYLGYQLYLPPAVSEFAGLRPGAHIPVVVGCKRASIIDINDDQELTFKEIAEIIDDSL